MLNLIENRLLNMFTLHRQVSELKRHAVSLLPPSKNTSKYNDSNIQKNGKYIYLYFLPSRDEFRRLIWSEKTYQLLKQRCVFWYCTETHIFYIFDNSVGQNKFDSLTWFSKSFGDLKKMLWFLTNYLRQQFSNRARNHL